MKLKYVTFLIFSLLSLTTAFAKEIYTPIPPGFDFPAQGDLLGALGKGDEDQLRQHAWMVFSGLTQPANPNDTKSEAIWETWYSASEVFGSGPTPQGDRKLQRKFSIPRQFLPRAHEAALQAIGDSALSFTLFNKELRDHTKANKLNLASTLESINDKWTPQTPVNERKILDYPTQAMSLKVIWKLVKKQELTALPIWDQQDRTQAAPAQPEHVWPRIVLIDPIRDTIPQGETRDIFLFGKEFKSSKVVPLSAFYHFQLTADQATQANQSGAIGNAEPGDYVAVVAMHYTTKEIPNWVWATFWWHDNPDSGRFAKGRPDTKILTGVWRNYLMDAAYDMDIPKESDGTANAVFNPYIEARFVDGVNSNCMTCHQRAIWSKDDPAPSFLPITRGAANPNDPAFIKGTTVDFLWSLLYEGNK